MDTDITALEQQIDLLIYHLYNLTYDEVLIVDPQTSITRNNTNHKYMSNLDKEIIIRRLAIIKYLYNLGAQQSMQVDMVAGFSILSFHDCAEMFLLLVAENKGMKGENVFMDYWNKIPELTLKESMRILKERRVNIKT